MSDFNYVNTFKPDPDPGFSTFFLPDKDVDVATQQNSNLGAMVFGSTYNPDDVPNFVPTPNGLILEVANQAPNTPPNPASSKTVYVVSNINLVGRIFNVPNKFDYAPFLSAELEFDLPHCSSYDYSPDIPHYDSLVSAWAVGLNFKTGDETDAATDQWLLIGPTCQFRDGGDIYFHMTDYPGKTLVHHDTYKTYADTNAIFTLRLAMERSDTAVSAFASLSLKSNTFESSTIAKGEIFSQGTMDDELTDIPIQNLKEASTNQHKITAIGVSVVNLGPVPQQPVAPLVSVRLLKFSLRYPTPQAITQVITAHPSPSGD